jgi:uncharacterized protein (DUF1778 family)
METTMHKDARLDLSTTRDAKAMLKKAATLFGTDLSSFMMAASMEKAVALLRDHATITVSKEGQETLASMLLESPAPTKAMKQLRAKPRLKSRV